MAVSDRVQEALIKLEEHDVDNALIQLSIAVDATAKKMFPQLKNAQRIKSFLKAKRTFIWWTLYNGIPNSDGEFYLSFADKGYVSIEDIMYKYIRCRLLHEGEAPANISFDYVEYFKVNADSSLILPVAYLYAILWAVISSDENKNEKMVRDFCVCFGLKKANLNDYWGDEVRIKDAIRNGFEYDCEAILKQLKEQA
ncbi:hypothetical protein [Ruminiclostridium cellobioparum]|uniref:hypothetical protein n=1 Tax=Ruminiclostridium cellobioparum TaxID=29355 RepID=UPI0004843D43|nr:hypothetical protein [Ruminiclostridium cellobioparum]